MNNKHGTWEVGNLNAFCPFCGEGVAIVCAGTQCSYCGAELEFPLSDYLEIEKAWGNNDIFEV